MPLFPESSTTDAVWKRRSRKWTLPALWVILAVWFLKANYFSNHSSDSSSTSSSPNSPLKTSLLHNPLNPLGSTELPQAIAANVSTSSKVAVIIETRRSGNIVPLILHFSAVLGPTWPLVIYTSAENFGSFSTSAALLRHQRSGRIVVRSLSEGVWFKNWDSVSAFLTSHWLWEDLAPAENILLFQSDSVLCSNAVRSVDDFFDYDLIGAPIDPRWGVGYNGGLSLRKRATVLRVLDEWSWATKPVPYPEDQWFYARMKDLQAEELENGIEDGINLPSMETARTFAVETIDFPSPLGLHQPTRFLNHHMLSLDEWCPEYRLATTERI